MPHKEVGNEKSMNKHNLCQERVYKIDTFIVYEKKMSQMIILNFLLLCQLIFHIVVVLLKSWSSIIIHGLSESRNIPLEDEGKQLLHLFSLYLLFFLLAEFSTNFKVHIFELALLWRCFLLSIGGFLFNSSAFNAFRTTLTLLYVWC